MKVGGNEETEYSVGWPSWDDVAKKQVDDAGQVHAWDPDQTGFSPARPDGGATRSVGLASEKVAEQARIDEVLKAIDETGPRRRRPLMMAAVTFLVAGGVLAAVISQLGEDPASDTALVAEQAQQDGAETEVDGGADVTPVEDAAVVTTAPTEDLDNAVQADTGLPGTENEDALTTGDDPAGEAEEPAEVSGVSTDNETAVPRDGEEDGTGENGSTEDAVTAELADVPESKAIVQGGKIYLEGAVPDEASAQAIVDLAAAILGPDNVINNYIIDSRADDPNLGNIRVDDTVLFKTGSAIIAPEFEPLLGQAVALMALRPSVTLTILGHTDSVGPKEVNRKLSVARAEAVVTWIAGRGIDPVRLTAIGRGENKPIASNDTVEGRQLNRRIQVFIENLLADE